MNIKNPVFPAFMRLYFLLLLSIITTLSSLAQHPTDYFRSPLNIPLVLSGTFGELRSNHFHAGIDIKTQGASGLKVYAVADGYVSRIKVSPWGYGKALYITHPNGYTSVYAHLKEYAGAIQTHVLETQYNKEEFAIELFPDKNAFPVKKGDVIALSGNTGGSAAPHLHFELRTSHNEHPQNGLQFGFNIKDNIAPIIHEIKAYPHGEKAQINQRNTPQSFEVFSKEAGNYYLKNTIKTHGSFGLGIHTHDLLNGANNKNGVYSIELLIDNQQIYYHKMDEFGFHETKYINSHIDYAESKRSKKRLHKCLLEPNNQLSIYENIENAGVIQFNDDSLHQGEFIVTDVYGNTSILNFKLQDVDYYKSENNSISTNCTEVFPYQEANIFKREGLELHLPKNALYNDLAFEYNTSPDTLKNCYSPVHHLHNNKVAVHKSFALSIDNTVPEYLKEKAFIGEVNDNGQIIYRGGKWVNNKLSTKCRSFGSYAVAVDTLSPTIKPLNIYPGKHMTSSTLRMNIRDDLSGIQSYRAEIDGKWVLMEYDPKKARLTHRFQKSLTKGNHLFTLSVTDERNNTKVYEASFSR